MKSANRPLARNSVNLWRIPLTLSVVAILWFCFTIYVDTLEWSHRLRLPEWLHNGSIDDARAILSAEMGATSAVLALIFSVSLLVLSMVATLFGPRLLYRFVQDWVTQGTIGMFMATFIYVQLTFWVTRSDDQVVFVPQLTLTCCNLLVLVSFSLLVYYSHRIAISIQNPDMVGRIVDDLERALIRAERVPRGEGIAPSQADIERQLADGFPVLAGSSGYLQEVDHPVIRERASGANAVVHLLFRPGQYVQRGEVLARVWPPEAAKTLQPCVERRVHLGRHRVLRQDTEFGLYQIVEIAIRALSPAVNDTFTGVACVDWIGDALRILAQAPQHDGFWYDGGGQLRLRLPQLKFTRLVKAGFEQIRQASGDTPAVLVRMLTTIARVAPSLKTAEQRQAMLEQARAIWDTAQGKLVALDSGDVDAAWRRAREALGGGVDPLSERGVTQVQVDPDHPVHQRLLDVQPDGHQTAISGAKTRT